ncbi:MAG TPA: MFS transporter [Ilumatobacteraceae bacterium]|nr:MFS transporter [Ilumatobacteraceae bacterium]
MASTEAAVHVPIEPRVSWFPLAIVMLCQIQVSFNAFNVSIEGIVEDLGIPATSVGLALTTSTFAMAGFVLLGARIGAKIGPRRALHIGMVGPTVAAVTISLTNQGWMLFAVQALNGATVALAAPALTVVIARNYQGRQQAQAIGFLASAIPLAQVVSLLIAGAFASSIGWRWSFVLLSVIGIVNLALIGRLAPIDAHPEVEIDWRGAALSSVGIIMISAAFSFLNAWGFFEASEQAPFDIAGLSPVPFLLVVGIALFHAFFRWTRRRMDDGAPVLFSLDVLRSTKERAIVACMALMLFIGTAASFLLPLYMQVVQGLSGFQTSLSVVPYTLSIFVANTQVSRLYDRVSPAVIARVAFSVVFLALTLLAFTIRNDWSQVSVVAGLVTLGLAQGCIVALVFNQLLTANPKELAGDVGAFRGLTHNIAGSVGIAVGTAIAVSLLGSMVARDALSTPAFSEELIEQVNFDNTNFVTSDQLVVLLEERGATPAEADAALEIYEDARLRSLRTTLMFLALLALLALVPAGKMPDFREPDLSVEDEESLTVATRRSP